MNELTIEEKLKLTNDAAAAVTRLCMKHHVSPSEKTIHLLIEAYRDGAIKALELLMNK